MFWDRRKKDRHDADKAASDPDRRTGSGTSDRRQWTCGILYKTSIPVTEIETWLEANAQGRWSVGLDSIDDKLSSKVLKIMFETQDDKHAFVEAFSRRR
jgi:hypothetical protein